MENKVNTPPPSSFLLFSFFLSVLPSPLWFCSAVFFILVFTSFSFPVFILSTNHRAWTRLPWPMPPFWMAAGAGPTVPWLAQWALWLSVFLLSLRSLILSTPQRWAYQGLEAHTGSMKQISETDNVTLGFGRLCCPRLFSVAQMMTLGSILSSTSLPTNCLLSDYWF